MRRTAAFLALLLAALALPHPAVAQPGRAEQVKARLADANGWRDHVMVVAHRGGWKEDGAIILPENSRAAIRRSIALGVEIVELDVRLSADGALVVMHDSWLDRTTTCSGEVGRYTLAELRACRLVVEGSHVVSDETVPTLAEMLAETRGRILVNVDNKGGPALIPAIYDAARASGAIGEIIVKENIWDDQRLAQIRAALPPEPVSALFMPVVADDAVSDPRFAARVAEAFRSPAVELITWRGEGITTAGGPLFSVLARAAAIRGNWHLWVNTFAIVRKPGGYLAGGRGDELAVGAGLPQESYGFWVERGATIIQTDEPKAAIAWLEANGYRRPYDDEPAASVAAAPSN